MLKRMILGSRRRKESEVEIRNIECKLPCNVCTVTCFENYRQELSSKFQYSPASCTWTKLAETESTTKIRQPDLYEAYI